MKNKISLLQNIMHLVLVVVAVLFGIYVSMGLQINLDRLKDIEYWQDVLLKLLCVLLIFNALFGIVSNMLRRVEDSKYYVTLATNRLRVDVIYKDKLFDGLDKAINSDNHDTYVDECNAILRNVTTRLSYSDLNLDGDNGVDVDGLCKKYMLNAKQSKQLRKAVLRIVQGKVDFERLTPDHILKDKDGDKDKPISATYDLRKYFLRQNIFKAVQFVVSSAVFAALAFGQQDMTFWQALLTNGVLFINAIVSGITFAVNYIKTRTAVFEQRNRFLERRMGLTTEYIAQPKPNK